MIYLSITAPITLKKPHANLLKSDKIITPVKLNVYVSYVNNAQNLV